MLAATIFSSSFPNPIQVVSLFEWTRNSKNPRFLSVHMMSIRVLPPPSSSSGDSSTSEHEASSRLDYDLSHDLLGLDVQPQPRNLILDKVKLRSWFGPNGQYIRELPCPSCRGRGYTPCTECGIERSRGDCSECNGKGLKTCQQCLGDRVIWEESIDEVPWEKARSSSAFKVKEDDEVDNLEIKVDVTRKSKRVYRSLSPEVGLKISRSLRILNEKTGLFSKRMKILHGDPLLHAQRVAAIKKAKGTSAARQQASETMKTFFQNPENRLKRSIAMKGVKFYCSHCGKEGHRKHYCPSLRTGSGRSMFRCRLCGKKGHNRRTCGRSNSKEEEEGEKRSNSKEEEGEKRSKIVRILRCRSCAQVGHNNRTCPTLIVSKVGNSNPKNPGSKTECKRTYICSFCRRNGHNVRTCPDKDTNSSSLDESEN